ncbi:MAG: hypothetical protein MJ234_01905 [bacterium]|nr:hypothetical protein [bacterium]
MKKFKGIAVKSDIEGGVWLLKCDDGKTYQISGHYDNLADGARVSVIGSIDRAIMGFAMAGPVIKAEKISAI